MMKYQFLFFTSVNLILQKVTKYIELYSNFFYYNPFGGRNVLSLENLTWKSTGET